MKWGRVLQFTLHVREIGIEQIWGSLEKFGEVWKRCNRIEIHVIACHKVIVGCSLVNVDNLL